VLQYGLKILEKVGEGSFGKVYRAVELATRKEVAIKVVLPPGEASQRQLDHLEINDQGVADHD
jgi:serine/threonine protein kinase